MQINNNNDTYSTGFPFPPLFQFLHCPCNFIWRYMGNQRHGQWRCFNLYDGMSQFITDVGVVCVWFGAPKALTKLENTRVSNWDANTNFDLQSPVSRGHDPHTCKRSSLVKGQSVRMMKWKQTDGLAIPVPPTVGNKLVCMHVVELWFV